MKPDCARVTGMGVRKMLESLCESYWNGCAKDAGIFKKDTVTYPQYSGSTYLTIPSATYTYNNQGEMASVSDGLAPTSNTIDFTYDSNGNLLTESPSTPLSSDTFSYDLNGNITGSQVIGTGIVSKGISPATSTNSATSLAPTKKTTPPLLSSSSSTTLNSAQTKAGAAFSSNCLSGKEVITFDTGENNGTRDANGNLTRENLESCNNNTVLVNSNYYMNYNQAQEISYFGSSSQGSSPNTYCYDPNRNLTLNSGTINQRW
ncbi:MAG: hypothetical protein HKL80_11325 [Acidimicrobiales bacterium]|nr:hypothetical protein [Acidimicrobiales bacterium]